MTAAPDLDAALADLAAHLDFPDAATVAEGAVARIAAASAGPSVSRRPAGRRGIRAAVRVGAALVLCLAVVVAVPSSRTAVAGWLGLGGVRVELVPVSPDAPAGDPAMLGERVTLDEAASRAGFALLVPEGLGAPEDVRLAHPGGVPAVTLLYRGGALLITGFPVPAGAQIASKEAGPGTTVAAVTVRGHEGLWLGGEPHAFTWSSGGSDRFEELRRATSTLLWTEDGILWRIEGVADLEGALRLAEGLRLRQ